jgi:hypothetical protein
MRKSYFLLIVSLILNYSFSKGQTLSSSQTAISDSLSTFSKDSLSTSNCQIRDINDVLRKVFKKDISAEEAYTPKLKKLNLLIIPSLSSNPANGFMVGINSTGTWHFGTNENTRMSMANAKVVYTTNSQLMAYLKTSIYTKNNDYFLQGDVRYYLYSLPTYGIGTNAPDTTYEANFSWMDVEHAGGGGSYPMKYNFLIFHQLVNRKIKENLYAGIGYQLDSYWDIDDELLNLDTVPAQLTPHWTYQHNYEMNTEKYALSGFSLNLMYDSRDNLLNPYKGYYAILNYRYNSEFLGSTTECSEIYLEFRTYVGIDKLVPQKLFAFWFMGNFQVTGHLPYYTMMALGDDQKGTSGRGYVAGRYRGESFLYGEVEYRFPFNKCNQTVGGVIFANATTASNTNTGVRLFEYVRPAIGAGVRLLMNKNVRLTIAIDYAVGYKSQGFYFNSGEAF